MSPNQAPIIAEGLQRHFGDVKAVDGVDLRVEQGEIFGFLGPNGAGKSTTIRLLLDLIRPTSGRAAVFGFDCQSQSLDVRAVTGYLAGDLVPRPQPDQGATYAPQLKKEDGHLDFSENAEELARRVRAFSPWPGAFCYWQGQPLKVLEARPISGRGVPGVVSGGLDGPALTCADGQLLLLTVQPAGKRPMSAIDFARGSRTFVGSQVT